MRLLTDNRGSSLIEYGVLAGLVATIAITSVIALSDRLSFGYRVADQELWMAMNEEANFLDNGDFDNVEGLSSHDYGFSSGSLDGWVSNNGRQFELHASGWEGMESVNGGYWLDMGESPGPMHITQAIDDLVPGYVYVVTLFAGDRSPDLGNLTLVRWNDETIGELKADVTDVMQEFTFHVEAQRGTNELTLMEVSEGENDYDGMSIDVVRIWGR